MVCLHVEAYFGYTHRRARKKSHSLDGEEITISMETVSKQSLTKFRHNPFIFYVKKQVLGRSFRNLLRVYWSSFQIPLFYLGPIHVLCKIAL